MLACVRCPGPVVCARSVCWAACASPGPLGSWSPLCSCGAFCCVCSVLDHSAPVHRWARSVCCVVRAVYWATRLLFTVCPLRALYCASGVLGHLTPVHQCARSVRCVTCAVSWTPWLLFTGVPARCAVLRVRFPGPLGSCSPVGSLRASCFVCRVFSYLAPVHQCARSVRCFACGVSWATWLLFTDVPAWSVVLHVRCPAPLRSCPEVCPLGALCCVCNVLGHVAPVHRCAGSVRCVAFAFFLGHFARVQRCARSVCCVESSVCLANWLLFTGVLARCPVLRVRFPGPPGFFRGCARSVRCVVCAVSCATWLLSAVVLT